ncbi:MAG TPA: hypothetical protein VGF76_24770 [Polyangiaceae bacterium]
MGAAVGLLSTLAVAAAGCIGCASTITPGGMSVAQHEAVAKADDAAANAKLCAATPDAANNGPCWGAQTEETKFEVAELRHRAAEHRNAAAVLKAEEAACDGVSEADRVQSPFSHHEDIVSVQPLIERRPDGETRQAGAVIEFRKVPRLTTENFQKILDCHLARDEAFGFDARELEYCPLNVNPLGFQQLNATVVERPNCFVVKLDTQNEEVAKEVLTRAQRLVGAARCLTTPMVNEST